VEVFESLAIRAEARGGIPGILGRNRFPDSPRRLNDELEVVQFPPCAAYDICSSSRAISGKAAHGMSAPVAAGGLSARARCPRRDSRCRPALHWRPSLALALDDPSPAAGAEHRGRPNAGGQRGTHDCPLARIATTRGGPGAPHSDITALSERFGCAIISSANVQEARTRLPVAYQWPRDI